MTHSSFKVMTPAGRDTLGVRVPERSAELLRDLVHGQTGMFYDESRLSFMLDRHRLERWNAASTPCSTTTTC